MDNKNIELFVLISVEQRIFVLSILFLCFRSARYLLMDSHRILLLTSKGYFTVYYWSGRGLCFGLTVKSDCSVSNVQYHNFRFKKFTNWLFLSIGKCWCTKNRNTTKTNFFHVITRTVYWVGIWCSRGDNWEIAKDRKQTYGVFK